MIPTAKPLLGDEEAGAVRDAIMSGWVAQGPMVEAFENTFARSVGARHGGLKGTAPIICRSFSASPLLNILPTFALFLQLFF